MSINDKIKIIEENKDKNYTLVSPTIIKKGVKLIDSYKTLDLYEKMDTNTEKITEEKIVNLISNAKSNDVEVDDYLSLSLIFCGDYDDFIKHNGSFIDFLKDYKEQIVALYKYVVGSEQRHFFVGIAQSETVYNYDYLYLNFSKLLESFDNNNISYEIDTTEDRLSSMYRDDKITRFRISYTPKKELESEKGHQLRKVKKDN